MPKFKSGGTARYLLILRPGKYSNSVARFCLVNIFLATTAVFCSSCTSNDCSSNIHSSTKCTINGGNGEPATNSPPSESYAAGSPAQVSPAQSSATGSASGAPAATTYIEDLQATSDSEPYDTQGVAQIDGTSYPHSQGAQFCFGSNERKWTYVLGHKYASFMGTIGLSDNSVSDAQIQFNILADGKSVYSKDLRLGQTATIDIPVSNVIQLELDTILLTNDGGCGAATGEWADTRAVEP